MQSQYTRSDRDSAASGSRYQLLLFVTSGTARSEQASQNIKEICENNLRGHYELEVVDVHENPELVSRHQVLAVPTLLKKSPEPQRRVVGDLREKEKVLSALDIRPA